MPVFESLSRCGAGLGGAMREEANQCGRCGGTIVDYSALGICDGCGDRFRATKAGWVPIRSRSRVVGAALVMIVASFAAAAVFDWAVHDISLTSDEASGQSVFIVVGGVGWSLWFAATRWPINLAIETISRIVTSNWFRGLLGLVATVLVFSGPVWIAVPIVITWLMSFAGRRPTR